MIDLVPDVDPKKDNPLLQQAAKKINGIFYSPEDVARKMIHWAVRNKTDKVFDPSFGGCVFLRAAVDRLGELGAARPERQAFGADSDRNAWRDADQIIRSGGQSSQFHLTDFFTLQPKDVGGPFVTVVGNPPYVRHHFLSDPAKTLARSVLNENGSRLPRTASYWALFVLHSLQFVAPEGRLCFILPGAFLHADYARIVRESLQEAFDRVTVILIEERIFLDAEEESVIVLAEGRGIPNTSLRIGSAKRLELELKEEVMIRRTRELSGNETRTKWSPAMLLSRTLRELYDVLRKRSLRLGDVAEIHIGIVTGAKQFFIVTSREARERGIEGECLHPVLARASQLRGLSLTGEEVWSDGKGRDDLYLFSPPANGKCPRGALDYINWGEAQGFHQTYKCSVRSPWYTIPRTASPDAVMLYLSGSFPRLVLNKARVPCTNTLLALNWRDPSRVDELSIATAMISSLAQLSAEIEGRSYGGGVLKLEPSDAARLVLPTFSGRVKGLYKKVDTLCRKGNVTQATALVDSALVGTFLNQQELGTVQRGLDTLRRLRASRTKSAKAMSSRDGRRGAR